MFTKHDNSKTEISERELIKETIVITHWHWYYKKYNGVIWYIKTSKVTLESLSHHKPLGGNICLLRKVIEHSRK